MKKVLTRDGSTTLLNQELQEHYHSISGAKEEAIKKFVEPCKISERESVNILDVCFGLGYNTAAAIDSRKEGSKFNIVALENDWNVLREIENIDYPFDCKDVILRAVASQFVDENGIQITVLVNDAKRTIQFLKQEFDVVFFDPFSPKKSPDMWSEEFLGDVFSKMNSGGILATYSCAGVVRETLKKVGFVVKDGPIVGRKSPGTLAFKPA